jgi:hypothetical protein
VLQCVCVIAVPHLTPNSCCLLPSAGPIPAYDPTLTLDCSALEDIRQPLCSARAGFAGVLLRPGACMGAVVTLLTQGYM